jgi:hypothetical protein
MDQVPNDGLRAEFQRRKRTEDLSLAEVARRCGWDRQRSQASRGKRVPDSSRVARYLGINTYNSRGYRKRRSHINYDEAVLLAEAIGADPVDVGL